MAMYDCLRCGTGYRAPVGTPCICKGMTEEQADFIKALHNETIKLRRLVRKIPVDYTASWYY